jgi:molecular chaperone GrpE
VIPFEENAPGGPAAEEDERAAPAAEDERAAPAAEDERAAPAAEEDERAAPAAEDERAAPAAVEDERAAPAAEEDERAAPAPDEEPVTARDEAAEPAGEEDAANEAAIEEGTERPDAVEEEAASEEEDPLALARRERDQYLDLARRAQADFENYRKRAAKEAVAAGQRAKSGVVRELLPVVDNLERALASAREGEQHLAEGVRLVHSELIAVLERNGVEQFDPKGESFDPAWHEALSTRSEDGATPGTVLDVVEKGYRANGAVLRPARVVVSG